MHISNRELFLQHQAQTTRFPLLLEFERAEGIYLYDKNNKPFIDLISGISVSSLGHGNKQVNQALRELIDYRTILPLPCNKNETICINKCFTQQKFYVTHKGKTNDVSKVSYRVIAKANLADTLVNITDKTKYVLQRNGKNIEVICPCSSGEKIIDGYKL